MANNTHTQPFPAGLENFEGSSIWEGFECILRYLKDLKFGIIHIGGDPTEVKKIEEEVRERERGRYGKKN